MLLKTRFSKLFLALSFSLFIGGMVYSCGSELEQPAEALQTLVGIDALMGNACNTGYTRVAPHICQTTQYQAGTSLANNVNTCNALDMHAGYNFPNPTTGFAVINVTMSTAASNNLDLFTDNTCGTTANHIHQQGTAGPGPFLAFVRTSNGNIYYKTDSNGLAYAIGPAFYYD